MNLYMIWLNKIFSHNLKNISDFIDIVSPEIAFNLKEEIKNLNIENNLKQKLLNEKIKDEAKKEYEYCKNNNINLVNFKEKNFPINLRNLPTPPPLLYYKGNLLPEDETAISIVGSRRYTEYGKLCTKKFASELASCKITIISGMAYGIDTFAHSYALDNGGRTIAVLGTSVDTIYPKENTNLYHKIIENGAVISEFPIPTPPISKNFPIRNRLVAGLSLGTLVVEANEKSGTMITARLAAEAGRNVYVIPGEIFNYNSKGTNKLIQDGAKLVTDSKDILEDIYSEISKLLPKPEQISLFTPTDLNEPEEKVYKKLSLKPIYIDALIDSLDIPSNEVLSILTILELKGYIKQLPGQQYVIEV